MGVYHEFIPLDEAARRTGHNPDTLMQQIRQGAIPGAQVNGHWGVYVRREPPQTGAPDGPAEVVVTDVRIPLLSVINLLLQLVVGLIPAALLLAAALWGLAQFIKAF